MRHSISTSDVVSENKITGREAVPRRAALVRVLFSDSEPLDVSIECWVDLSLKVGMPVTNELMIQLKESSLEVDGYDMAIRYLAHKPRTEKELITHLVKKGVPEPTTKRLVMKLRERGHINDELFATLFQDGRASRMSRAEISWKLKQKGISSDYLQPLLQSDDARSREREAALRQAQKHWRIHRTDEMNVRKQKLRNFLLRKGFPQDVATSVLNTLVASETGEIS